MLTRRQHELLMFIDRQIKATGFSPSFDEMKDGLDLKSKSGIHRLISALEERGFLVRRHNRARALEVMRLPEDMGPHKAETPNFAPNVIRGDFTPRLQGVRAGAGSTAVDLPMYGRIAAGLAIEAVNEHPVHVQVPTSMLGSGEHYALEVAGDSMIEAGIWDGDTVIIRRDENAETGEIVVALVDDNEVTLKRFRKRGNSIALEPANASYKTQIFPADRVRVQGKLVGLLRQY